MWSWCVFVSICDLNHEALWLCPGLPRLSSAIRGNRFWHPDGHERHPQPANKATCHIRPSCFLPAGLWNVVHPLSFLNKAILQIQGQRLLNLYSSGGCKMALSMWNYVERMHFSTLYLHLNRHAHSPRHFKAFIGKPVPERKLWKQQDTHLIINVHLLATDTSGLNRVHNFLWFLSLRKWKIHFFYLVCRGKSMPCWKNICTTALVCGWLL